MEIKRDRGKGCNTVGEGKSGSGKGREANCRKEEDEAHHMLTEGK